MSDLSKLDIAEANLMCATGLPGAEGLQLAPCLATLDQWAQKVCTDTEQFRPRFRPNPSCPTEEHFRCFMLIKSLRDGHGLKHHLLPEKGTGIVGIINRPADGSSGFEDSRPLFLHGLLGPERIGSCSSLPVLYAAVGRRLGYPIKLGLAVGHVFIRWDGDGRLFNMDGSGPDYINSPPDDYFIDKPRPWTPRERSGGYYLRSITPVEELALFLSLRGACLKYNGQLKAARENVSKAMALAPGDPVYPQQLRGIEAQLANPVSRSLASPGHDTGY